jgi:hypothetical protein
MSQPAGRFSSIREFIEEAINGQHTAAEATAILDQIEMGIGLRKRDEALAAEMERDDGPPLGPEDHRAFRAGRSSALEVVVPALAAVVQGIRRTKNSRCPVCRSKLGTASTQMHRDDCLFWAAVGLVVDHPPVPADVPPGLPEVAELTVEVRGGEPVYHMTTHDELARRKSEAS